MSPNGFKKRPLFSRILRAPLAARSLVKAFDLAAKDRPEEALSVLNKARVDYEGWHKEFHLLRAHVSHRVSEFRLSVDDCDVTIDLIEAAPESSSEDNYELLYAVWVKDLSLKALGLPGITDDRWDKRFEELDLNQVSSRLKRDFPLPWHPDWPEPDESASSA